MDENCVAVQFMIDLEDQRNTLCIQGTDICSSIFLSSAYLPCEIQR